MARPPRIPNLLPLEQTTIYFITLCVEGRKPILANSKTWNEIRRQLAEREKRGLWKTMAALAMPDHLHALIGPLNRDVSINDFISWFKRSLTIALKPSWKWQSGCFDRLLRSDESAQQKWDYIQQNPIRAGLVKNPEEWPYQTGFDSIL